MLIEMSEEQAVVVHGLLTYIPLLEGEDKDKIKKICKDLYESMSVQIEAQKIRPMPSISELRFLCDIVYHTDDMNDDLGGELDPNNLLPQGVEIAGRVYDASFPYVRFRQQKKQDQFVDAYTSSP